MPFFRVNKAQDKERAQPAPAAASTPVPDDARDRAALIIRRLIQENAPLTIETLAQELYVSRATVDRLVPEMRRMLAEYDLSLVSKSKRGILVEGTEFNKRVCMAHLVSEYNVAVSDDLRGRVQRILWDVTQQYGIELSEFNFHNLVQHCAIAIQRIGAGNMLAAPHGFELAERDENCLRAAAEISAAFEREFGLAIPEGETDYIAIHLLGKEILRDDNVIDQRVIACVDEALEAIAREREVDLRQDAELKLALILHVQPMLVRAQSGLGEANPFLTEVKRDMADGFEMALTAARSIEQSTGVAISEDEAAYLAMHFTVATERLEKRARRKKVIVSCSSGRGTAELLRHRLVERSHFLEEDLVLVSALELDTCDFSDVLAIFTTVPLSGSYPVPWLLVDLAVGEETQRRIRKLMRDERVGAVGAPSSGVFNERLVFAAQDLKTRDEVLHALSQAVAEEYPELGEIEQSVLMREDMASTEVGNQLALPHPYAYKGTRLVVAVLSLKKPVPWKYGSVRLVVLSLLPERADAAQERLNMWLAQLSCDAKAVNALARNLSLEALEQSLARADAGAAL